MFTTAFDDNEGRTLSQLSTDEARICLGTSRLTVAAGAVYTADRLPPRKHLRQADVVEGGSVTVTTSQPRLLRYSQEVHEAFVERHGIETVGVQPLAAD